MSLKGFKTAITNVVIIVKIENIRLLNVKSMEEYVLDLVFKRKRSYDQSEVTSVIHYFLSLFVLL